MANIGLQDEFPNELLCLTETRCVKPVIKLETTGEDIDFCLKVEDQKNALINGGQENG